MANKLTLSDTPLAGVRRITTAPFTDGRGRFERWFCREDLAEVLEGRSVIQINFSRTEKTGTVRGLHYQRPPHAEMKLVRCVRGRVWDVAVDLRTGSSTFLQWHAEELSPGTTAMMALPEGVAHGFQTLEPGSELVYIHTAPYVSTAEAGIRFDDPQLKIPWPLPAIDLSPRDLAHPLIGMAFPGIRLPS